MPLPVDECASVFLSDFECLVAGQDRFGVPAFDCVIAGPAQICLPVGRRL